MPHPCTLKCKLKEFTKSQVRVPTFFPLAIFFRHITPSAPNLSNTNPKYINFLTFSTSLHSARTEIILPSKHYRIILICISHSTTFSILNTTPFLHLLNLLQSAQRSSTYNIPGNLYSLPSSENLIPNLLNPSFTSFNT